MGASRFTHVDPFEDTERLRQHHARRYAASDVSPTSIRSRILKGASYKFFGSKDIVSPTSIRSRILKDRLFYSQGATAAPSFTHVDPFEDTERSVFFDSWAGVAGFTHVDPFEDTERLLLLLLLFLLLLRFTHVDPFEDTERSSRWRPLSRWLRVSPTSIRSRILKDSWFGLCVGGAVCFTHVDPFEDTESAWEPGAALPFERFTHVDPFEDTERRRRIRRHNHFKKFHPRRSVRGY